jgi:hypothetical protein
LPFKPYQPRFGRPPAENAEAALGMVNGQADDCEGLPTPHLLKLAARRAAGLAEAKAVLALLPGPNESLHALATARMDLTDIVGHLLERYGTCERLLIATLGYNAKNLAALVDWLDAQRVLSLTLLASIYFRSLKPPLWSETLEKFSTRPAHAHCVHSHAKVITLHFTSGAKLAIEGSANLSGNGSGREQFMLVNSPALHDWHAGWILEMATKHERAQATEVPGQK